jgi:hypothetical protein
MTAELDDLALNPKAGFQDTDAVSGYWNLCTLGVFEREDDLASEPGVDLLYPIDVDECGAVDAEEAGGIEAALELGDSLIDAVPASDCNGVSELVVSYKVSYGIEVEK